MQKFISRSTLRHTSSVLQKSGKKNVTIEEKLYHTVATAEGYNGFVSGTEPASRSLACQIVTALQLGERSEATSLLSSFSSTSHVLNSNDFDFILDYCAKSPDPLFVMETWKVLKEKNVGVSDKCYLLIIQALCAGGYLEEAFGFMKFLGESQQLNFSLPLYNYFLSACAKVPNMMLANQCLDLMDCQVAGKNEITYTALLKIAVSQKNLSAVQEICKEYIRYYSANIISLRKFIWSFTRLKDLDSAFETLQQLVTFAAKEETFLKKNMAGKLRCRNLDVPIPLNNDIFLDILQSKDNKYPALSVLMDDECLSPETCNEKESAPLVAENGNLRAPRISVPKEQDILIKKVLRWSFNDVIHACAQARNCQLAEQLVLQMQDLGLKPSSHTYDGFIRAIISDKGVGEGIETLKRMHRGNLKPYDSTLAQLSAACSRALDLELAEILLNEISHCPRAYPYNAFLAACDALDQPERAVRMLAKMRRRKVNPDVKTYELLFSLFSNVNAPYEQGDMLSQVDAGRRINAMEMDMLRNGIQHSQRSMKNLLKALGNEGMTKELLQYLRIAEQHFSLQKNSFGTAIYNIALHALVEAKESYMAIEIFRKMKLCALAPDAATYEIMIDCCSEIRCFKSACSLVSMMIREGFSLQTSTYTALIKILLECDNFDEALDLLGKVTVEGNQPDVLLFNTILNKASFQGRIDVVELIIEKMHREKMQPDPSTCAYVFSAYVDKEYLTTAMEALQVLSIRMISEDETVLQEASAELEGKYISTDDPEAEKNILKLFHNSQENLASALLNLRWCAMAGLSISWTPDQSPWARRLATTYNTTKRALPNWFKMLYLLLEGSHSWLVFQWGSSQEHETGISVNRELFGHILSYAHMFELPVEFEPEDSISNKSFAE